MADRRRFHLRIYTSSDSYPEIRPIETGWPRHVAWFRAFLSSAFDARLWLLFALELSLAGAFILLRHAIVHGLPIGFDARGPVTIVVAILAVMAIGTIHLSWGGDLMRPHLRKANAAARHACPNCGHLLSAQLNALGTRDDNAATNDGADATREASMVRCPECGHHVPTSTFRPPYAIPPAYRALAIAPPPVTD